MLNYNKIYITTPLGTDPGHTAAMESKTARLTVLIDPNKKQAFERLCASQDITPSQVVRQLIRNYLTEHGASYTPSEPVTNPRVKTSGR